MCVSCGVVVCVCANLLSFVQCLVINLCFFAEFFFNRVVDVWPCVVLHICQG